METELKLDFAHTAVLAMDCQAGIVSIYAKPKEEFVERASSVLRVARTAGMPVVLVQVGFRPGLPEVSDRNKFFAAIKSSVQRQSLFQGEVGAIHPGLGPEPGDIIVVKHRVSAFAGTDLRVDPPCEANRHDRTVRHIDERRRAVDSTRSHRCRLPGCSHSRLLCGPGCRTSCRTTHPAIPCTRGGSDSG